MALLFKDLREKLDRKPSGSAMKKFKHKGVRIEIYKYNNEYVVFLDGDRLDTYPTPKEAERMAKEFSTQLKGK